MLIINKKPVPCKSRVIDWSEHGMCFVPGSGSGERKSKPDLIVVHWTGGEGDARQLYSVLRRRRLGIEFFISREGHIYQFCDPASVYTFNAGEYNKRSIGIEISDYGFRWTPRETSHKLLAPRIARDRLLYQCELNGLKRTFADFYKVQKVSLFDLIESLSLAFDIPIKSPGPNKKVSKDFMKKFNGVVGHFHINKRKSDPGPKIFDEMNFYFYGGVGDV